MNFKVPEFLKKVGSIFTASAVGIYMVTSLLGNGDTQVGKFNIKELFRTKKIVALNREAKSIYPELGKELSNFNQDFINLLVKHLPETITSPIYSISLSNDETKQLLGDKITKVSFYYTDKAGQDHYIEIYRYLFTGDRKVLPPEEQTSGMSLADGIKLPSDVDVLIEALTNNTASQVTFQVYDDNNDVYIEYQNLPNGRTSIKLSKEGRFGVVNLVFDANGNLIPNDSATEEEVMGIFTSQPENKTTNP